MINIYPENISTKELHQYLVSSIGPRPIALASTVDKLGNNNVSPFSFFNIFSANPPIAIFSPARRVRDNTTKDTLENITQTKEVVINIVTKNLVEQASLSSLEYPADVDEFIKAGITPIKSEIIKPPRVKESPIQMECIVNDIISLGENGGAGNLIICEIKLIHISKHILNIHNKIDPNKLQLVGRLGKNWYCDAFDNSLFEINNPTRNIGIGFDQIPDTIKKSKILTKNNLARLASIKNLPSKEDINIFKQQNNIKDIIKRDKYKDKLHKQAQMYLHQDDVESAWKCLLIDKLN
jgi:flavin reductase (DIM6/NTAB) family NADH-FMN oxidoreductase RutF